jgi:hypothetical protein
MKKNPLSLVYKAENNYVFHAVISNCLKACDVILAAGSELP